MQQVNPVIENAFGPAEKVLRETSMPDLIEGLVEGAPERGVTRLTVKQLGLALPDPTHTAPENWMVSCVITGHLVAALRGQVEFRTADHPARLWEVRTAVWRQSQQRLKEALAATLVGSPVQSAR